MNALHIHTDNEWRLKHEELKENNQSNVLIIHVT